MNKLFASCGVLLAGCLLSQPESTGGAAAPTASGAVEPMVLGTFDSRAVLTAHVRSKAFSDYLAAQRADIDKATARARDAGDQALVAALDELGPAMQRRIHEQGFGTAPIDDLLATLKERLPVLAKQAGVDAIVCKWDLVYTADPARCVDVTELLVEEFAPDEATWKAVRSLMASEPVSAEQLRAHRH